MIVNVKRNLGNTNKNEVHDTENEQSGPVDEIKDEHQPWYDTLEEAKGDRDYDNCAWCLGAPKAE